MFSSFRDRADTIFKKVGSKQFVDKSGRTLIDAVIHFHEEELSWLKSFDCAVDVSKTQFGGQVSK